MSSCDDYYMVTGHNRGICTYTEVGEAGVRGFRKAVVIGRGKQPDSLEQKGKAPEHKCLQATLVLISQGVLQPAGCPPYLLRDEASSVLTSPTSGSPCDDTLTWVPPGD